MEAVAAIDEDIMKRWLKNVPTKSRTNYNKLLKDVLARICQETATDIQKGIEIVRSDELVTHLRRYLAEKPLGTQKKIVSAVQSFRNFDLPHPAKPLSWKEEKEVSPASVESLPSPYGAIAILLNQTGWEYSYLQGNLPDAIDLTSCPSWMGFGTLKSGFPQASAVSEALKVQGLTVRMLRFAQRIDVSTDRMQSIGTLERRGRPQEKPQKVIKDKRISLTDEQFRHQLASSHLTTTRRPTILDLNPEIRSSADLVPPTLDDWLYKKLRMRMVQLHDQRKPEGGDTGEGESDDEALFDETAGEAEMPETVVEGEFDETAGLEMLEGEWEDEESSDSDAEDSLVDNLSFVLSQQVECDMSERDTDEGVRSGANGSGLAPLYDSMKTRVPSRRIRLRRYHESESDLGSSSDSEDGMPKLPDEAFQHIRDAGMTTVRLTRAEYDDVMEKREQEKHQK
ncbi:hypothetical protein J8273_6727 [Carpediemonas membranifera]|uniref:Uncharacterized protein n=1 Tax=Carpediemonas membranifera TaxID=201153 RepID=A0A8J6B366_9EUKA|nr:hypothetical protein J8273_6727 [Carpediemonas membranifera]|eukprot:KAG9391997.1 hypothetical protein J8273_6727 [Carpediemonas membranifera]